MARTVPSSQTNDDDRPIDAKTQTTEDRTASVIPNGARVRGGRSRPRRLTRPRPGQHRDKQNIAPREPIKHSLGVCLSGSGSHLVQRASSPVTQASLLYTETSVSMSWLASSPRPYKES